MFPISIVETDAPDTLAAYDSLEAVESSLEPFDVLNDEYLAWDSEGRFLRLETTEDVAFGHLDLISLALVLPRLFMRLTGRGSHHEAERGQDQHWLTVRYVTGADVTWLTTKVRDYARACGVEYHEAMLNSATAMLRRLKA